MTKSTFIKFTNAVQSVILEGKIPESAKLRFVESLAQQVKAKKRIVKEAASDARSTIEDIMDKTFGTMHGSDPQEVFYDYTPNADNYEITVMALGDKEKAQQQKHVTNFVKQAKLVDGVESVDVGEWDGDGDENRPYGLDIVVKFAEAEEERVDIKSVGKIARSIFGRKAISKIDDYRKSSGAVHVRFGGNANMTEVKSKFKEFTEQIKQSNSELRVELKRDKYYRTYIAVF